MKRKDPDHRCSVNTFFPACRPILYVLRYQNGSANKAAEALTLLSIKKITLMFATYKLPRFLDYLYDHYQKYYQLYVGRLTELFPSDEQSENTLAIAEDNETTESEDEALYHLWVEFK